MTRTLPCPTCQHIHPEGIGAQICGCRDCDLLHCDIPFEYLAPEFQERLRELRAQQVPA